MIGVKSDFGCTTAQNNCYADSKEKLASGSTILYSDLQVSKQNFSQHAILFITSSICLDVYIPVGIHSLSFFLGSGLEAT